MATYSSNKNCRSKSHSSTDGKRNIYNSQDGIKIECLNMVQLTPAEQRTFVIKTFYETNN
jgi:hypothetical protein